MRHDSQNVAARVDERRRAKRGAVRNRLARRLTRSVAIDERYETFALEPCQRRALRGEPAFAVRSPGREHRARCETGGDRATLGRHHEFDVNVRRAILSERRVFGKGSLRLGPSIESRHEAALEQDLRTIADSEHGFPDGRAFANRSHHAIVRGDRAGSHTVLVGKAPRQDVGIVAAHDVEVGGPRYELRSQVDGLTRAQRLFFAVRSGKDDDAHGRTHYCGTSS